MRTSGIVAHAVLGARRLSTDPRPLTYDPANLTITGSDGRKVDLSKDPPVLENADGEKVYPFRPDGYLAKTDLTAYYALMSLWRTLSKLEMRRLTSNTAMADDVG